MSHQHPVFSRDNYIIPLGYLASHPPTRSRFIVLNDTPYTDIRKQAIQIPEELFQAIRHLSHTRDASAVEEGSRRILEKAIDRKLLLLANDSKGNWSDLDYNFVRYSDNFNIIRNEAGSYLVQGEQGREASCHELEVGLWNYSKSHDSILDMAHYLKESLAENPQLRKTLRQSHTNLDKYVNSVMIGFMLSVTYLKVATIEPTRPVQYTDWI